MKYCPKCNEEMEQLSLTEFSWSVGINEHESIKSILYKCSECNIFQSIVIDDKCNPIHITEKR